MWLASMASCPVFGLQPWPDFVSYSVFWRILILVVHCESVDSFVTTCDYLISRHTNRNSAEWTSVIIIRPEKKKQNKEYLKINPIALRKAKIANNFGLSECNKVKQFTVFLHNSCGIWTDNVGPTLCFYLAVRLGFPSLEWP